MTRDLRASASIASFRHNDHDSAQENTGTRTHPQSHPGISSGPTLADHHQLHYKLHRQATELRETQALERGREEGQYSISKLEAFEKYQSSTSMSSAILVLAVTPLPCVIVVVLLESIPLQDLSLDWRGNPSYLARTFCAAFVTAIAMVFVTQECIPEVAFTWKQAIIIGSCQSVFYIATTILLAEASGMFPTPFALAICLGPMVGAGVLLNYLFARHRIPSIADFSKRYTHVIKMFTVASLPMVAYPAYTAVFMQLSSHQQLWCSLLLPVVKQALRSVMLKATTQRYVNASNTISVSVSLFHTLFAIACIQHSKTNSTMGLVLLWNAAHAVRGCASIVQYSRRIAALRKAALIDSASIFREESRQRIGRHVLVLLGRGRSLQLSFDEILERSCLRIIDTRTPNGPQLTKNC